MEISVESPRTDLLLTIRGLLPSLNGQEQKVGPYVLDHPIVLRRSGRRHLSFRRIA